MTSFSQRYTSKNQMIVLSETSDELVVALAPGTDPNEATRAANVWECMHPGGRMRFTTMQSADIVLQAAQQMGEKPEALDEEALDERTSETDAPAIALLNAILLEAVETGASDIHIERSRENTLLRLRIDGTLKAVRSFDGNTGKRLIVRIKLLANLNTLEARRPQDGKFRINAGSSERDIRVSTLPCDDGESTVLRFLNSSADDIALERLGFPEEAVSVMRRASTFSQGLVIIAGPTGCGKTTTLAAFAKACGPDKKKIVSLEDPIEYKLSGITQVQTNDAIGLDFSSLLRRILRQDPDIIIVGEIRDGETAKLAVRAALTGHLVVATLHVSSAKDASIRLENLGIARYLVEATLRCVISQRLVRRFHATIGDYSGRLPIEEILFMPCRNEKRYERTFRDSITEALQKSVTTEEEITRVFGEDL